MNSGPFAPIRGDSLNRLDLHADGDGLFGPALPDAGLGGYVGIVTAAGSLDVVIPGKRRAGGVDVEPAARAGPDLAPGVGCHLTGLVNITAHIARRQTDSAACGQEQ